MRFGPMSVRILALMIAACVSQAGCSSGTSSRDPVYKVTGKVTYKGAPVVGADITFLCTAPERSAFGRTNDEGVYNLTTFSANDGAVEGKHSVTIKQLPVATTPVPIASTETDAYVPPEQDQSTDPVAPKSTLPANYGDAATSGLIAVVSKDGENVHDFPLE